MTGISRSPWAAVAAVVLYVSIVGDGQPASGVEQLDVGPKIGERVESFTLTDQNGAPRTLESLMGPRGTVLVFFRSADW